MKICVIGPHAPWSGGIAKYLDLLADALEKQRSLGDPRTYEQDHIIDRITFSRQYLNRQKVETYGVPKDGLATIDILNPLSWAKTAKLLSPSRLFSEVAYDLAIFKYWHPAFALPFGYIANRLRSYGTKICFIVDNVMPHEYFPIAKTLARHCLFNGDLFITHSQKVTDDLIKLIPTAFVKQIPHPTYDYGQRLNYSDSIYNLGLPFGKRLILFFGYIRPYKGLDTLLHAFAIFQAWQPDAVLLIAGEPFEKIKKYKLMADALGISQKVIWHDHYIPDDQVHLYFSAADLMVLPYKTATQSGMVEIARGFDLPIIGTSAGGLDEQLETTVAPGDFNALSQAMLRFFTDSQKCRYKQPKTTFEDLAKTITDFVK